jgi:HEAT repeat protein
LSAPTRAGGGILKGLFRKLRSENRSTILAGLAGLSERLPGLQGPEFEEALHAVIGVFYIDPIDHPQLVPALERAEDILADLKERAIPILLRALGESDFKIHFRLASTLAKMGRAAVTPLLSAYANAQDDYSRVFALYALGKVNDSKLLESLPVLFQALEDQNPEVRDTAARALGKVCTNVKPELLDVSTREECFERLVAKVSDRYAGVRSKAIRSLGKMARASLLTEEHRSRLRRLLSQALGQDEAGNWDVAYIVRAEAEKALEYL